jgi:hypothetical protein
MTINSTRRVKEGLAKVIQQIKNRGGEASPDIKVTVLCHEEATPEYFAHVPMESRKEV